MRRTARRPPFPVLRLGALLVALAPIGAATALAGPDDLDFPPALTTEQLDELVAPVALYPDVVLDSLLPASVVPGDVAAAARYVASQGGSVQGAPDGATWDVGVVALLQFPDVLQWMGDHPQWVDRLGFAVAMQQGDVLAAIQRYRAKAQAAGVLDSNEHVSVESGPQIVIRTLSPHVVYIPVYDPQALDSWTGGRPFYHSWLSFSFGTRGYWGRYHIFWGAGIYDYGEPWWWGRWRSRAVDWRVGRPARWTASRHGDQPWMRAGWRTSGWGTRLSAPRTRTNGTETLRVNVAPPGPPTRSRPGRHGSPGQRRFTGQQPTAPAAPITRWSRTTREIRGSQEARPVQAPSAPAPSAGATIQIRPSPLVGNRAPVRQWRRRGNQSLEHGQPLHPNAVRTQPTRQAAPARQEAPVVRQPQVRSFPSRRPEGAVPDGRRARVHDRRGHRVLTGS